MLLVPSRLMNPNWQGLRHGEIPSSLVKQVFSLNTYREPQGSLQEQRPFTWSQCGQYYKLSSHSFYAASTLKVDTGKSHCSHTQFLTPSRGCHIPSQWPFGNPDCLNITGLSCIILSFEIMESRNVGTLFFSSCA